jgi:chromosome segregation ATPase
MDQDLLNYLDQRFSSIDRRFDQVDLRLEAVDQHLEGVDRRLEGVDRRLEGVDHRIEKLEADIRGAYVLIEGLQSEVRLVAADGILNLTEQLNRHREEVARKLGELEALNKLVFAEFRRSHRNLEARVTQLEATG